MKKAPFRGYIIKEPESIEALTEIKRVPNNQQQRPIWFIYSGMGSHWPGMAQQLLHIPDFKASLEQCAQVVSQFNMNLMDIIQNSTSSTYKKNPCNSLVAIAAIQVR